MLTIAQGYIKQAVSIVFSRLLCGFQSFLNPLV